MLDTVKNAPVNGLYLAALGEMVEAIDKDAGKARAAFRVTTRWTGQTRSESVVDGFDLGGERITRQRNIAHVRYICNCKRKVLDRETEISHGRIRVTTEKHIRKPPPRGPLMGGGDIVRQRRLDGDMGQ